MAKPKAAADLSLVIGAVFTIFGIVSIDLSIFYASQILALIGLGLTFWGVVFFLTMPKGYLDTLLLTSAVYPEYLTSAVYPEYSTLDRITNCLECEKGYYIPTLPIGTVVPGYLKGLKDPVIFVPAEADFHMPSVEDISQGKFLLEKGKGILLTPPGLGLLKQIEKKMKVKLNGLSINEICEVLPNVILEDFALAKDLTMTAEAKHIHLSVQNSVYKSLYDPEDGPKSARLLGCPIVSAIACILAQASGKTIALAETNASLDGSTIEIEYQIVS